VKYTFELGGNCVTADYGKTDVDGVISVTNIVRIDLPAWAKFLNPVVDSLSNVKGFAAQSSDTAGALTVSLGPTAKDASKAEFRAPGNYWIIKLGEINDDGLYEYAVVSDDRQSQLYVLVRDVARFRENNEADVLATLKDLGFTNFFNKPLPTNQDNCDYSAAA
jgi:lipocalin